MQGAADIKSNDKNSDNTIFDCQPDSDYLGDIPFNKSDEQGRHGSYDERTFFDNYFFERSSSLRWQAGSEKI